MLHRGFLVAFVIVISLPGALYAAEKQWQAGVAKVNITPELPIWLSGTARATSQQRQSTTICGLRLWCSRTLPVIEPSW